MKKPVWIVGILGVFLILSLVFAGCDGLLDKKDTDTEDTKDKTDNGGATSPPSPSIALSKPVWSNNTTANKNNVNEMMTRLWSNSAATTVQDIIQGQVFSYTTTTVPAMLLIDASHITAGLKGWITAQWGGTSVPVKVDISNGTPTGTVDTNWSSAHLIWIDLANIAPGTKSIELEDEDRVEYMVVKANSFLELSRPVWTANTGNKDKVNDMMARLWSDEPASFIENFTQGQVFSYDTVSDTLTVTADGITNDLKGWITTQWGGTSVPIKVESSKGTPTGNADPNWSGAHLIWIDLAKIASGKGTINLTGGGSVQYNLTKQ